MLDKYGAGQDPYCYRATSILRNRLNIRDDAALSEAERALSEVAAANLDFALPPYDLPYLQGIHRELFTDLYEWAGELRSVDISKGSTHFCTVPRIEPEAIKLLNRLQKVNWFADFEREALVQACAELYGDLNMVHPFREGNGRAQRIFFEHLILNAGFDVNWWGVEEKQWIDANVAAVVCDYVPLKQVFEHCIGPKVAPCFP